MYIPLYNIYTNVYTFTFVIKKQNKVRLNFSV